MGLSYIQNQSDCCGFHELHLGYSEATPGVCEHGLTYAHDGKFTREAGGPHCSNSGLKMGQPYKCHYKNDRYYGRDHRCILGTWAPGCPGPTTKPTQDTLKEAFVKDLLAQVPKHVSENAKGIKGAGLIYANVVMKAGNDDNSKQDFLIPVLRDFGFTHVCDYDNPRSKSTLALYVVKGKDFAAAAKGVAKDWKLPIPKEDSEEEDDEDGDWAF